MSGVGIPSIVLVGFQSLLNGVACGGFLVLVAVLWCACCGFWFGPDQFVWIVAAACFFSSIAVRFWLSVWEVFSMGLLSQGIWFLLYCFFFCFATLVLKHDYACSLEHV
jgi:hypothetical protein